MGKNEFVFFQFNALRNISFSALKFRISTFVLRYKFNITKLQFTKQIYLITYNITFHIIYIRTKYSKTYKTYGRI